MVKRSKKKESSGSKKASKKELLEFKKEERVSALARYMNKVQAKENASDDQLAREKLS